MNKNVHFYVQPKSAIVALMTLCLSLSAVGRIYLYCSSDLPTYTNVWLQLVLPVAATVLYMLTVLLDGQERFYKTAIPVWLFALFSAVWVRHNLNGRMLIALSWMALFFFCFIYTDLTSGIRLHRSWLLFPLMLAPMATVVFYNRQAIFLRDWNAVVL